MTILGLAEGDKVVYLLRDGRDSMVSMAHQTSDLLQPGSDFSGNLSRILLGNGKDYFGGWSRHVNEWQNKSDIIIRFENLIIDPGSELKPLFDLLKIQISDKTIFPTLQSQKEGSSQYSGKDPKLFFRKGKIGEWKTEMSQFQQWMCKNVHGSTLMELGYEPFLSFGLKGVIICKIKLMILNTLISISKLAGR